MINYKKQIETIVEALNSNPPMNAVIVVDESGLSIDSSLYESSRGEKLITDIDDFLAYFDVLYDDINTGKYVFTDSMCNDEQFNRDIQYYLNNL